MRKIILALLLFCSAAFADAPPAETPEGCVSSSSSKGQEVTQCGGFATIKQGDKVTVCNLGEPGTTPRCQEIPKEEKKNPETP